jgi:hypothetical protein
VAYPDPPSPAKYQCVLQLRGQGQDFSASQSFFSLVQASLAKGGEQRGGGVRNCSVSAEMCEDNRITQGGNESGSFMFAFRLPRSLQKFSFRLV